MKIVLGPLENRKAYNELALYILNRIILLLGIKLGSTEYKANVTSNRLQGVITAD
jgi:hypothetical protein